MKKIIARGAGAVAVSLATASMAMLGATAAHADSPMDKTYEDARSIVQDSGAEPVLSTVTGDQLALDECIVTGFSESVAQSALGEDDGKKVLLNLNCNAKVAQAGTPGNSVMTPQGRAAKQDIKVANQINKDPEGCYASDEDLAYCKRVCSRSGLCEADAL